MALSVQGNFPLEPPEQRSRSIPGHSRGLQFHSRAQLTGACAEPGLCWEGEAGSGSEGSVGLPLSMPSPYFWSPVSSHCHAEIRTRCCVDGGHLLGEASGESLLSPAAAESPKRFPQDSKTQGISDSHLHSVTAIPAFGDAEESVFKLCTEHLEENTTC